MHVLSGRRMVSGMSAMMSKLLPRLERFQSSNPSTPGNHGQYDLTRFQKIPHRTRFGAGAALLVGGGGIALGSWLSQKLAEFLEINEIFIPDDDDD